MYCYKWHGGSQAKHIPSGLTEEVAGSAKLSEVKPSYSGVLKSSHRTSHTAFGTKEVSDSLILKPAKRLFWMYLSGIDPSVETDSVIQYLKGLKDSSLYQCEKLNTKYNTYNSFKIGVPMELCEELLHPNLWPEGCIVGKYRAPRTRPNLTQGHFLSQSKQVVNP